MSEYKPLIHCITNPISMMQCANTILGLGARPIMAEHPLEVSEITATADALLLNLGNISDSRMEAMKISFSGAIEKNIPVVVDAVGVACSELRRKFIIDLMKLRRSINLAGQISDRDDNKGFLVLKGNYSEIMALYDEDYRSEGVDAKAGISVDNILTAAMCLSEKYEAAILASGKTDVIVYGDNAFCVDNGCPELSMITGTGCMLGAICATLLAKKRDEESVAEACALLGIAGEIAADKEVDERGDMSSKGEGVQIGTGTFLVRLLDNISLMTDEIFGERNRIKRRG